MSAAASLQGRRVLVTRPAAQAENLCRLLQARGAEVRRLPLQSIEAVRQPAAAARQLREAHGARAWIFTSVNAVEFAAQLDAGPWPQSIAIGAATAVALEARGQLPLLPEDAFSSEGVLALPLLQAVAGQRLLIVTGEKSRQLMAETLRARGAQVELAAVYRRVALPHTPERVRAALQDCDAVLLTSGEALQQLLALCDEAARALLCQARLVVPSQRVVEQARTLGCQGPLLLPEQVSDAAYLHCLEQALAS
ncbi:uroporphyrinogen-III synthase [Solimonas aquatica]|uniref:Uroporphyrinogen-III synthase n=1 Tax=Solimonas aquatica TaxID=489703 RepID=A0A1H9GRK5_9GAMM|nr:uroporphyrinogen-III synthase [Solimonas aquatica]SEQ52639.1 uroporphyrinogen-III synthase [Solimonas aquatica]